jgi:hypothetical protein
MRDARGLPIDLVEELKLRRWARLNHVGEEARRSDWHPVILEEMALKDAELAEQSPPPFARQYAPIGSGWREVHAAHVQTMPRFLAAPTPQGELHYT